MEKAARLTCCKDADAGTVSVRQRGVGDLGAIPLETFMNQINADIAEKKLPPRAEEQD